MLSVRQGPGELDAGPECKGASVNVTTLKPAKPGNSGDGQRDSKLPARLGQEVSYVDSGLGGLVPSCSQSPGLGGSKPPR